MPDPFYIYIYLYIYHKRPGTIYRTVKIYSKITVLYDPLYATSFLPYMG